MPNSTQSSAVSSTSRLPLIITSAYYAAFIGLGLLSSILGPTLNELARHTGSNLSQISLLFTASSLGYMLGSFFGGQLLDRLPGHPLMAFVLVIAALCMVFMPVIPILWILVAVALCLGIAQSTLDVGCNSLLIWLHGEKSPPFINGLHFFFGLGAFLSPILVAQAVLASGNITWAYWMLGLLMLPAAAWILFLPSPRIPVFKKDEINAKNNLFLVILITLFFILYVGAEIGFGGWIFTYVTLLKISDVTAAAYLTSAFWGSFTAGRLVGIPLAARYKPETLLLVDLIGSIACILLVLLGSHSILLVWIGSLGIGVFLATVFPTMINFAGSHIALTGKTNRWFFFGSGAGGMILPWLIGQLFVLSGPRGAISSILVDLILEIGLFAILLVFIARRKVNLAAQVEENRLNSSV
ncbi:MAG: MFS transporter [Omnitrophica WOR_2 bacterium]